jgi:hypothetical protein
VYLMWKGRLVMVVAMILVIFTLVASLVEVDGFSDSSSPSKLRLGHLFLSQRRLAQT